MHGNAGNRALSHRVTFYKMLTRFERAHVFVIDYRGFGDSSPAIPTEETTTLDAIAAHEYIAKRTQAKIVIVGHSLGSGIAVNLAAHLTKTKSIFAGIILLSAYANLADAAFNYGTLPILRPFVGTFIEQYIKNGMIEKYDSKSSISRIKAPVLLIHGKRDGDINVWHSKTLFLSTHALLSSQNMMEDGWGVSIRKGRYVKLPALVKEINTTDSTIWSTKNNVLVQVEYAGHNSLSEHLVVEDAISSWIGNL